MVGDIHVHQAAGEDYPTAVERTLGIVRHGLLTNGSLRGASRRANRGLYT